MAAQDLINKDILDIMGSAVGAHNYFYSMVFKFDGEDDLRVMSVIEGDIIQDFRTQYMDDMVFRVLTSGDQYIDRIYPNRENLTVVLELNPIGPVSENADHNRGIITYTKTALLMDSKDPNLSDRGNGLPRPTRDGRMTQADFYVQLIDPPIEQMRLMLSGATANNDTVGNVIRYVYTRACNRISVDQTVQPQGIIMDPPSNTEKITSIIIPQDVYLPDIARYAQKYLNGVYSTGIGTYYWDRHWYVYPLYDVTKYQRAEEKLVVYRSRANYMPVTDRSWTKENGVLSIVATGSLRHNDTKVDKRINEGNGVRQMRAQQVFDEYTVNEAGKATASRKNNTNEFVSEQTPSGRNNMAPAKISNNLMLQTSLLAERSGEYIQMLWDHCVIGEIYPGMPCKFVTEDGEDVKEMYGTVVATHYYIRGNSGIALNRRHHASCAITLFVA